MNAKISLDTLQQALQRPLPTCKWTGGSDQTTIDRVDANQLSYDAFWAGYMLENRPVVISNVTEGWRSVEEWVAADGTLDLDAICRRCARSTVQVADCNSKESSESGQCRLQMSFEVSAGLLQVPRPLFVDMHCD